MPNPEITNHNAQTLRKMVRGKGASAAPPLPVNRAFRQSLARITDQQFELELDIRSVEDKIIRAHTALNLDIDSPTHFSVFGPQGGPGMAVVSHTMIQAIVELRTVGHTTNVQTEDRITSVTMAKLVHDYLDAVLMDLSEQMKVVSGEEWVLSQRLGEPIFDLHKLPLEVPDIELRMLRAEVSFGRDGPRSEIALILPASPATSGSVDLGNQTVAAGRRWRNRLETTVKDAKVNVDGILSRQQLSVDQVRGLAVGGLIPLPEDAHNNIRLEGIDGGLIGIGSIGMVGRSKAIRFRGFEGHLDDTDIPDAKEPETSDPMTFEAAPIADQIGMASDLEDLSGGQEPESLPVDLAISDLSTAEDTPVAFDDLPELSLAN